MIDPYGVVLAALRADSAVAAIAGTRIGAEVGTLPCVVLVDLASTRIGRWGQYWTGVARCYAEDTPTGAITARQLAGAVSDALDDHDAYRGTSLRMMLKAWSPTIDGLDRDPDTRWPLYTVTINGYFAAQTVPALTGFDLGFDLGFGA